MAFPGTGRKGLMEYVALAFVCLASLLHAFGNSPQFVFWDPLISIPCGLGRSSSKLEEWEYDLREANQIPFMSLCQEFETSVKKHKKEMIGAQSL